MSTGTDKLQLERLEYLWNITVADLIISLIFMIYGQIKYSKGTFLLNYKNNIY